MTDAASISETSVNFYQTTQRNNPEDSNIHIRRHYNQKLDRILTHLRAVTTFTPSYFEIHFNIILLPVFKHPKVTYSLEVFVNIILCVFLFSADI